MRCIARTRRSGTCSARWKTRKKRPGDLDLAVTYVNLAQHYAAQDENDARIAACLDKAMERMDSPDAVWEYYYAHTARKIARRSKRLGARTRRAISGKGRILSMKGLELSRAFWEDAVRPAIRETCPCAAAAACCGALRRWFGLLRVRRRALPRPRLRRGVHALSRAGGRRNARLPSLLALRPPAAGVSGREDRAPQPSGNGRYGVKTTEQFLLEQTGLFHTPETWREWMAILSYALAAACAGEIFYDGSGDMTGIRETLRTGMPEDVRVKKDRGTRRAHGAVRAVQRLPAAAATGKRPRRGSRAASL